MAKCLGDACVYGREECCRDCAAKETCEEVCDGYDEAGCEGDCLSRSEK